VPLDDLGKYPKGYNNAIERVIRGPVVGRKNHYRSRSERGTEIASLFYSMLETAKLAGKDSASTLLRLPSLLPTRPRSCPTTSTEKRKNIWCFCGNCYREWLSFILGFYCVKARLMTTSNF
jgi:hypothetical protein